MISKRTTKLLELASIVLDGKGEKLVKEKPTENLLHQIFYQDFHYDMSSEEEHLFHLSAETKKKKAKTKKTRRKGKRHA